MDLDTCIGGHVHRLGTKEDIDISREWLGRLGAVDVFTRENALTVALSQIVDAPRDI
ncbi:hypothetical protein ACFYXH_07145 [Streptomyces sp. NPDC002730]|uniref:hypothetical protein n=1 Tax=Streptomyces sp. NPDC002730 TaxID=3364662 RepID=UPI0036AFB803